MSDVKGEATGKPVSCEAQMLEAWGANQEAGVELAGGRSGEWRSETEREGAPHLYRVMAVRVHLHAYGGEAAQVVQRILVGPHRSRGEGMGTGSPLQSTRAGASGFPPFRGLFKPLQKSPNVSSYD